MEVMLPHLCQKSLYFCQYSMIRYVITIKDSHLAAPFCMIKYMTIRSVNTAADAVTQPYPHSSHHIRIPSYRQDFHNALLLSHRRTYSNSYVQHLCQMKIFCLFTPIHIPGSLPSSSILLLITDRLPLRIRNTV